MPLYRSLKLKNSITYKIQNKGCPHDSNRRAYQWKAMVSEGCGIEKAYQPKAAVPEKFGIGRPRYQRNSTEKVSPRGAKRTRCPHPSSSAENPAERISAESEEIPIIAQFSPRGGNGAVMEISERFCVDKKRCRLSSRTKNQLEAQRSGFELERRSKGAERSFKAAPKGTALKRSGADFAPTWCGHGDLNPNALLHENLNLACLPIPSCPR